jgi:sigma-E factor negative regulatory protein RseC
MVEEIGSIVEVRGKQVAIVMCEKSSFCEHCASMESCQVGNDNKSKLVEAYNVIGAQVGDKVRLSVSSKTFLQSSFLLYIVPLIALIVGAIAGQAIGSSLETGPDPNVLAAILGTAFMIGSFFVIRVGSRALPKENYMPRIVAVLEEKDVFTSDLKHGH